MPISTSEHIDSPADAAACPVCKAIVRAGADKCWLCGADIAAARRTGRSAISDSPGGVEIASASGFSLASLLMLMTLVCVVLGVLTIAPGLGVLVLIALVPALAHSIREVQRRKK